MNINRNDAMGWFAAIVILVSLIAFILFMTDNGSLPVGPALNTVEVNSIDVSQNGTVTATNIDELNFIGATVAASGDSAVITIPTAAAGGGGEPESFFARRNSGTGQAFVAGCVTDCIESSQTGATDFQDVAILIPFFLGGDQNVTVTDIYFWVSTAAGTGGDAARVGIYSTDYDPFHPGDLLIDCGTAVVDSTGGKAVSCSNQALTANTMYWLALVTEDGAVKFRAVEANHTASITQLGFRTAASAFGSGIGILGRTFAHVCGTPPCGNGLPDPAPSTGTFIEPELIPALALRLN